MKVTKRPPWFEDRPAWERHEVRKHYDPDDSVLRSEFLSSPVPLDEARSRRQAGEPLEYILGHCHLADRTIKCDERALIPRHETENFLHQFVETVSSLPEGPLVDCGTGTGFLAGELSERTARRVLATERYPEPLSLARENCSLHDWKVGFVRADRLYGLRGPFAGIVANLPYVLPGSDQLSESVREYEPDRALFVRDPAIPFYRNFIRDARNKLTDSGEFWMEGAPPLFDRLRSELSVFSSDRCTVVDDLHGRQRFLKYKK
jgi:release factor glutamine methyltransferase